MGRKTQLSRRGPKLKIGDTERTQILAVLEAGGSLSDAAAVAGVDYTTVYRLRKADPKFARGVRQAVRAGKYRLIQKVSSNASWQAAAWLLERRWGKQFGRKDQHQHEHKGVIKLLPMKLDGDVELEDEESEGQRAVARAAEDAPAVPKAANGHLLPGPVHRN